MKCNCRYRFKKLSEDRKLAIYECELCGNVKEFETIIDSDSIILKGCSRKI